jgi:hypothetical protein
MNRRLLRCADGRKELCAFFRNQFGVCTFYLDDSGERAADESDQRSKTTDQTAAAAAAVLWVRDEAAAAGRRAGTCAH